MTPSEKLQHLVKLKVIGSKLANAIQQRGKVDEFVIRFEEGYARTYLEWDGKKKLPFENLR